MAITDFILVHEYNTLPQKIMRELLYMCMCTSINPPQHSGKFVE